jgi:lysyl-tRNA synthetase class 2
LAVDNNIQVIAKIPNPYIPQKFATASEVATLDFLRNELGIPVPRVFAWSSGKDQLVGVEYIIMEKAAGNELGKSWARVGPRWIYPKRWTLCLSWRDFKPK